MFGLTFYEKVGRLGKTQGKTHSNTQNHEFFRQNCELSKWVAVSNCVVLVVTDPQVFFYQENTDRSL